MKYIKFLLALLTAAMLPATAPAQNYSLRELLQEGLQNSYSLKIVRNDEQTAANNNTLANAGALPTVSLSAGYSGALDNTKTKERGTGLTTHDRNVLDHTFTAGITADWTLFDGFKIQTDMQRLRELQSQSRIATRVAIEDYIANLTAEYFNLIQQEIRYKNLLAAVQLSKERLRIVEERYIIGSAARLDYRQAGVDFNADSSQCLKQLEALATSRIRLNELMSSNQIDRHIFVPDTVIHIDTELSYDSLLAGMLRSNSELLNADHNTRIAAIDLKAVRSRDYPYVTLNAGYGYTHNRYGIGTTSSRSNLGLNFGATIGFNLFDGNRKRERRNAQLALENAEWERNDLEISLRARLADLWQAYCNNLRLLSLERENLTVARENHLIARERFLLGDLAGIEIREAQNSLLDAEERLLIAEYDTKVCEISLLQISGKITSYLE